MNARVEPVAERSEVPKHSNILVIQAGSFGACVQSVGAIQGIRQHHMTAQISLLTNAEFAEFAQESQLADDILPLTDAGWWDAGGRMATSRRLRRGGFDRVYDLGGGRDGRRYRRLIRQAEWSATSGQAGHLIDRQRDQLHDAGIAGVPLADLSWVSADISGYGLEGRYVLFVLAGEDKQAQHWPAEKYAALARRLLRVNLTPVLLGNAAGDELLKVVRGTGVGIRNLMGRTTPAQIAELARGASGAIGNDTDIMHLVTLSGCPTLVLYPRESTPTSDAPRPGAQGGRVLGLQRDDLRGLSVDEVEESLPFPLT